MDAWLTADFWWHSMAFSAVSVNLTCSTVTRSALCRPQFNPYLPSSESAAMFVSPPPSSLWGAFSNPGSLCARSGPGRDLQLLSRWGRGGWRQWIGVDWLACQRFFSLSYVKPERSLHFYLFVVLFKWMLHDKRSTIQFYNTHTHTHTFACGLCGLPQLGLVLGQFRVNSLDVLSLDHTCWMIVKILKHQL